MRHICSWGPYLLYIAAPIWLGSLERVILMIWIFLMLVCICFGLTYIVGLITNS